MLAIATIALVVPAAGVAQAARHIPEACAVPPYIDLTAYHVIIGTDESETITGTSGPDFICALVGDDVIRGKGGNDLILGDTTTFFGQKDAVGGHDTIFAGRGDDEEPSTNGRCFGAAGIDTAYECDYTFGVEN